MSLKLYERLTRQTLSWNEIPDYSFQVSQSGFAFVPNNFFYENMHKATQQLTSAGMMDYLVEDCFPSTKNIVFYDHWSILTVESLSFGFVIWLGCCGICVIAFTGEIFVSILQNKIQILRQNIILHNIKQAKVHPLLSKSKTVQKNYPNDKKIFKKKICEIEDLEFKLELNETITNEKLKLSII